MKYFVVAPDGIKYGPADEEALKQWVAENRLDRNTLLEEVDTRQRLRAESLAHLFPPLQTEAPPAETPILDPPLVFEQGNPAPTAAYPRTASGDSGERELTKAWIWTIVGIILPLILPAIGLSYANKAIAKGNEDAHSARIFAITVLVAQVVILLITGVVIGFIAFVFSQSN